MMAFSAGFDGTTLVIDQTADDGVVFIDNNGPGSEFQVGDLAGMDTFNAATNVVLNLLDGTSNVVVQLDNDHAGALELNLGNGDRAVVFVGASNSIGRDLTINSNAGSQTLQLSQLADLEVGGNIDIDTGSGDDIFIANNRITGGREANLTGVDNIAFNDGFEINDVFSIDNSGENTFSTFENFSGVPSTSLGGFEYSGGLGVDQVNLTDAVVEGTVVIDLGDGMTGGGDDQTLTIDSVTADSFQISSGVTDNSDNFSFSNITSFGNVSFDLGEGNNNLAIDATIDGDQVTYVGGAFGDSVLYNVVGSASQTVEIDLGSGIDFFQLFNSTTTGDLSVDFGEDVSIFANDFQQFNFDVELRSLNGFDHFYDVGADSLSSIENEGVAIAAHEIRTDIVTGAVIVNSDLITAATNLNINLLDQGTAPLNVAINGNPWQGDLNVNLGSANRESTFLGTDNQVLGNLNIIGGDGAQTVELDNVTQLFVDGTLNIDLGAGNDVISDLQNGLNVGGDVLLTGVNSFQNITGTVIVGRDVQVDNSGDNQSGEFLNQSSLTINGDFTYVGSDRADETIRFDSALGSLIDGNVQVDLRDNAAAVNFQSLTFDTNSFVGGNVNFVSTSSATMDGFAATASSTIMGNLRIDLGDGDNTTVLNHTNGGDSIRYFGGNGIDQVAIETVGSAADFFVNLGDNNDSLLIGAATNIDQLLRVDFGVGDEALYVNQTGPYSYDATLFNYNGFNVFYDFNADSLRVKQTRDLGDVTVNDSAAGFEIGNDTGSYVLTPATDLAVTMRAESNSDIEIDLNNNLAGNLNLRLRRGDRDVFFTGSVNQIDGDLRIDSSSGIQNIHLSENAPLTVGGNAVINLRTESDSIIVNNSFSIGENLILRNVNDFEVTDQLVVAGNFTHATHFENENTRLDNDGLIDIGGRFTYLGGGAADRVLLAGNSTINDVALIDLGANGSGTIAQSVDLSGGFFQERVTILAAESALGNHFISDANSFVGGNFFVNFSNSSGANSAILRGQFDGSEAAFRGGSGSDTVRFGAVAIDSAFATLLGDGDDELTLEADSDVLSKFVDFGLGMDSLIDEAIEDYPLTVVNLT